MFFFPPLPIASPHPPHFLTLFPSIHPSIHSSIFTPILFIFSFHFIETNTLALFISLFPRIFRIFFRVVSLVLIAFIFRLIFFFSQYNTDISSSVIHPFMNRSEATAAAGQVLPVLEKRPLLRCEPEFGALICLTCNNGFPRNRIVRHLNARHG